MHRTPDRRLSFVIVLATAYTVVAVGWQWRLAVSAAFASGSFVWPKDTMFALSEALWLVVFGNVGATPEINAIYWRWRYFIMQNNIL